MVARIFGQNRLFRGLPRRVQASLPKGQPTVHRAAHRQSEQIASATKTIGRHQRRVIKGRPTIHIIQSCKYCLQNTNLDPQGLHYSTHNCLVSVGRPFPAQNTLKPCTSIGAACSHFVCRTKLLKTAKAIWCQPITALQETGYFEARTWKKIMMLPLELPQPTAL